MRVLISLILIASVFLSPAFADKCRLHDQSIYNFSSNIINNTTTAKLYLELKAEGYDYLDRKNYVFFSIPLFLERLKTQNSKLVSVRETGNLLLSIILGPEDIQLKEIDNLITLLDNAKAKDSEIKKAIYSVLSAVTANEQLRNRLNLSVIHRITLPLPANLSRLIALSKKSNPDAVIYQGVIHTLLASLSRDGKILALNSAGFKKINLNRIKQEMRFLGYSCDQANIIANQIPNQILSGKAIYTTFNKDSVTYSIPGLIHYVKYPSGYLFNKKLAYDAVPLSTLPSSENLSEEYFGLYKISDFAYGLFNNITIQLPNFSKSSAALNLIRNYPDRNFEFHYNPAYFAKHGIYNFESYFFNQLVTYGLKSVNIKFKIDTNIKSEQEEFNSTWSRDQWANVIDVETKQMTRASYNKLSNTETSVPVNFTEGGAVYPIGKYIFMSKTTWANNYSNPDETSQDRYELVKEYTGRIPIFVGEGLDNYEPASGHIDTYLIFLPQKNNTVAIGVPDYILGKELISSFSQEDLKRLLRERFLTLQQVIAVERDLRPTIGSNDYNSTGLPAYLISQSYDTSILEFSSDRRDSDSPEYDQIANWFKAKGFEVFRYPAIPGFTQANGFVEVTNQKASFTATSFGLIPFDAALADIIKDFGFSLNLIPATSEISEGAGMHCITNENRLL
jgi:hypothetical protein